MTEGKANRGHVNVLDSDHSITIGCFPEELRSKVESFL